MQKLTIQDLAEAFMEFRRTPAAKGTPALAVPVLKYTQVNPPGCPGLRFPWSRVNRRAANVKGKWSSVDRVTRSRRRQEARQLRTRDSRIKANLRPRNVA